MKAYFAYNPERDSLIPCRDAGLSFEFGDILEMVNQDDPHWWQARHLDTEGPHAGLVPSQTLEERRKSFRATGDTLQGYSGEIAFFSILPQIITLLCYSLNLGSSFCISLADCNVLLLTKFGQ